MSLKWSCRRESEACVVLEGGVPFPVPLFLTEELFSDAEEGAFAQIVAAASYPTARAVAITPDVHSGYVVPIGCVIATDGALCHAPVGYDIGCGMMALRSDVDVSRARDHRVLKQFTENVTERVGLGLGLGGKCPVDDGRFEEIVRNGAIALGYRRGESSERDFIPVDDDWSIPDEPKRRGIGQLGSLGAGNHFIELQHDQDGKLWVMVHTGSRGFGHALASAFVRRPKGTSRKAAQSKRPGPVYFLPDEPGWRDYRNAVAAGANFAIANRLLIGQGITRAFRRTFGAEPELVYELSHNMVQEEEIPEMGGRFWVHRKGATRAWPAGHPGLAGTRWYDTGHPVLVPGSMGDTSYVLFAEPGAARSLYSVNHGCGRRLSRTQARESMTQAQVDRQMADLGVMVNGGTGAPIDESPNCYKPSSQVIDAVVRAGLARVAWELTPIASIKGAD